MLLGLKTIQNIDMQDQIQQLETRIAALENMLSGAQFKEMIREIVFFDQDAITNPGTTTAVVTGVNFNAQTVTTKSLVTKTPVKFLKLYFRGQVYEIPIYKVGQ